MPRPERRQVWLLLIEVVVPLLVLGAAEVVLRGYAASGTRPLLPRFFPFPVTTAKYLAYRDLATANEPIDVLLMGMSPMMRVNAGQLGEVIGAQLGRPVQVFNFAAPLHTVGFNERLLRDILLEIRTPRLVVYGVMPINLLHDEQPETTADYVRVSPIFAAYDGTVVGRAYGWLLDRLSLVRYRDLIRDRLVSPLRGEDFVQEMAEATDARGDIPFVAPDAPVTAFTAWEQDYVREFRSFDQLMDHTLLFDHLLELARFCRSRGIEFVLLNNAVHPLFLHMLPHGRADYDRFVDRLRAVATEAGVPFFDPADGGVGAPELFQDTHHHNVRGSAWLTEQIAAFIVREHLLEGTDGNGPAHPVAAESAPTS